MLDLRANHGPFDVIGDVHGCLSELTSLLSKLGYVDGVHPNGRTAVFLGDLVDRGPDSPGVLRLVMRMVELGNALAVMGNHEYKLVRALEGRQLQFTHGLDVTMRQLADESAEFRAEVAQFCADLPSHILLDEGRLVVAHAGLREDLHLADSGRARSFALFGDTNGEVDDYGLPVRLPWQNDYRGEAVVLYGHTPKLRAEWINNTLCLDTACVFGGTLSALRYPERELVQVAAEREYVAPSRPLE